MSEWKQCPHCKFQIHPDAYDEHEGLCREANSGWQRDWEAETEKKEDQS